MKIAEYLKEKMGKDIIDLFSSIYPDWAIQDIKRMAYDENQQLHVTTKVAIIDDKIVGQANIFRLINNPTVANLGYHVHPDYRRRGIGVVLASAVIDKAKEYGIKILVIQTEIINQAAIKLAKKLGFDKPPKAFIKENVDGLKLYKLNNGICLYKLI